MYLVFFGACSPDAWVVLNWTLPSPAMSPGGSRWAVPSLVRLDCKGALPLCLAAMTETDDVLVVTLPAAGAPKRSKGSWPPVPVGKVLRR